MSFPFSRLLIRYIVATFIACLMSYVTMRLGTELWLWILAKLITVPTVFLAHSLTYAVIVIIGFSGVFIGTFCLEQNSRRYGSILLTGPTLFCYICYGLFMRYSQNDFSGDQLYLHDLFFIIGGLIAVLFFWLRKPRNMKPKPTLESESISNYCPSPIPPRSVIHLPTPSRNRSPQGPRERPRPSGHRRNRNCALKDMS
jgi:hypothetical protein